jgi:hypothetical protein
MTGRSWRKRPYNHHLDGNWELRSKESLWRKTHHADNFCNNQASIGEHHNSWHCWQDDKAIVVRSGQRTWWIRSWNWVQLDCDFSMKSTFVNSHSCLFHHHHSQHHYRIKIKITNGLWDILQLNYLSDKPKSSSHSVSRVTLVFLNLKMGWKLELFIFQLTLLSHRWENGVGWTTSEQIE